MKLEYFILENTWLAPIGGLIQHGWGNGYVIIPPEHPFYGIHYDILNSHLTVHGGLTFSEYGRVLKKWPGYKPEYKDYWIIGFDTCHYEDDLYRWPKSAVEEEVADLAKQCEELDEKYQFDINFHYFPRKT